MSDRFLWCAPLLLGLMLIYAAGSRPKPGARWYGQLIVGIAGAYLLYVGAIHLFPMHR